MLKRVIISMLVSATALAGLTVVLFGQPAAPQTGSQAPQQGSKHANPDATPPTDAEIRARAKRVTENQHKNDEALEQFERIERHMDRTGGSNPRTVEDDTYRVVPTGGGTMKLLLKDGDKPTDPAAYREQLQLLENILEMMSQPNNSKGKAAREKFEKRKRERAEFVDAASEAYLTKWVGRETYSGHDCDVVELDPNPNFHPHSMFQSALAHVSAKVWVDHEADQIVRGEAHVLSDISFGGGILGKLYRGGVVSMDQAEVAPGVWLPTRTQYDFSGRKFLFPFEQHQTIEASHYRRIGPPAEALPVIQSELASRKSAFGDP
ncbi:MAG: hypothetical protein ABR953_03170 [Candidatus Acidiferrales bacterium]|jgi:hypothetical protein